MTFYMHFGIVGVHDGWFGLPWDRHRCMHWSNFNLSEMNGSRWDEMRWDDGEGYDLYFQMNRNGRVQEFIMCNAKSYIQLSRMSPLRSHPAFLHLKGTWRVSYTVQQVQLYVLHISNSLPKQDFQFRQIRQFRLAEPSSTDSISFTSPITSGPSPWWQRVHPCKGEFIGTVVVVETISIIEGIVVFGCG